MSLRWSHVDAATGIAGPVADGGGPGAVAPASVHTRRELPEKCPSARGFNESKPKRWAPRAAEGRGSTKGWRDYARAVADELDALGWGAVGARMRRCGTGATVRSCNGCGDKHASIAVLAGCDNRACVLCARRHAQTETRRVTGAVRRVPGFAAAGLAQARHDAADRVARWDAQRSATDRRDRELARAKRDLHALRDLGAWRWRLITLSPPWDPMDRAAYAPAGLAQRVTVVRDAWRRLWDAGLSAGGLAAALWRVELSSKGHVHAHVLYFGPFVTQSWLAETAGMIVDVRAVRGRASSGDPRDAVAEAVKYALKGPSPRAQWLAGKGAHVAHPRLAAAWVVASRGKRLQEAWGTMRAALAAQDACGDEEPREPAPPCCASCGSPDLGEPWTALTASLAAQLGDAWTLRPKRELRGGAEVVLPARVAFVRPTPASV